MLLIRRVFEIIISEYWPKVELLMMFHKVLGTTLAVNSVFSLAIVTTSAVEPGCYNCCVKNYYELFPHKWLNLGSYP